MFSSFGRKFSPCCWSKKVFFSMSIFSSFVSFVLLLSSVLMLWLPHNNNNNNLLFVLAADCTESFGTDKTVTLSSTCTDYVFHGGLNMNIKCEAGTSMDGIYFESDTCTNCNIDISGCTIKNMIYSKPGVGFSGGTILIRGNKVPLIVFEDNKFLNNVAIDISHNEVTFDASSVKATIPTAHPTVNPGGVLPSVGAIAVVSVSQSIKAGFISIVQNKVAVTATETNKILSAVIVRGTHGMKWGGDGDSITGGANSGFVLFYGNDVACTGCSESGLELAVIGRIPQVVKGPYSMKVNTTFSYNRVSVQLLGDTNVGASGIFSACKLNSSGYVAPILSVEGNDCSAGVDSSVGAADKFFKQVHALDFQLFRDTLMYIELFDLTVDTCAEAGKVLFTRNIAVVDVSTSPHQTAAFGLSVAGIIGSTETTFDGNKIDASSATGGAVAFFYDPRCFANNSYYAGVVIAGFPNRAMLRTITVVLKNQELNATGKTGEVIGVHYGVITLLQNPPSMLLGGNQIPLPIQPTLVMQNSVLNIKSTLSNRTRGVYLGFEHIGVPPFEYRAESNVIQVHCQGSPAVSGSSCEGESLFFGLPAKVFTGTAAFITFPKNTQGCESKWADSIQVTCEDGFERCVGINFVVSDSFTEFGAIMKGQSRVAMIENGDQYSQAGSSDFMKQSSAISFARTNVVSGTTPQVLFKLVQEPPAAAGATSRTSLSLKQVDITKTTPFIRSLLRVDAKSSVDSQITFASGGMDFRIERHLGKNPSQKQDNAPVLVSLPFTIDSKVTVKISSVYAEHNDWCTKKTSSGDVTEPCPVPGGYARFFTADPSGNSVKTGSSIEVYPTQFRGAMQRRCVGYFAPEFGVTCAGCAMKLGCKDCSDWWTGLGSSASTGTDKWSISKDNALDECPVKVTLTQTVPYVTPPYRTPSVSHELTETDELTLTRELIPTKTHMPTATPALTMSRSLPLTRTPTFSLTIPECFPGMHLTAKIRGTAAPLTRTIEREAVRIILRIVAGPGGALSPYDSFFPNITKNDIKIVDKDESAAIDSSSSPSTSSGSSSGNPSSSSSSSSSSGTTTTTKFTIDKIRQVGFRTIEVWVRAPEGVNSFRDDVAGAFRIDDSWLKCRWADTNSTFQSNSAVFERRFQFASSSATQAVIALGLIATNVQTFFVGSSGISFWYAVRRSVGFYDAVTCSEKKDSLLLIIDSPMQLQLGDGALGLARGAVIGNGIIALIFTAIVLGASIFRSQTTWKPLFSREAQSWAGAPSWLFPITAILLPGTTQSIIELFAQGSVIDIGIFCLFFGIVCVLITPALVAHAILPAAKFWQYVECPEQIEKKRVDAPASSASQKGGKKKRKKRQGEDDNEGENQDDEDENDDDDEDESSSPAVREKPQYVPVQPSLIKKIFAPSHKYKTIKHHFINRYGFAFDHNHPTLYWVTVADVFISFIGGVVAGWPASREDASCRKVVVAHCSFLILGIFLMGLQPFTVRFDNVATIFIYLLGVSNAILSIVADLNADAELLKHSDGIVFSIMVLCFVKGFVDIFRLWKIAPTWAVARVVEMITRKKAKARALKAALKESGKRSSSSSPRKGGRGGKGGLDDEEMKKREDEEEEEIAAIERKKQLSRRSLPAPSPVDPEDLRDERRRRQKLVEPMLEELAAPISRYYSESEIAEGRNSVIDWKTAPSPAKNKQQNYQQGNRPAPLIQSQLASPQASNASFGSIAQAHQMLSPQQPQQQQNQYPYTNNSSNNFNNNSNNFNNNSNTRVGGGGGGGVVDSRSPSSPPTRVPPVGFTRPGAPNYSDPNEGKTSLLQFVRNDPAPSPQYYSPTAASAGQQQQYQQQQHQTFYPNPNTLLETAQRQQEEEEDERESVITTTSTTGGRKSVKGGAGGGGKRRNEEDDWFQQHMMPKSSIPGLHFGKQQKSGAAGGISGSPTKTANVKLKKLSAEEKMSLL